MSICCVFWAYYTVAWALGLKLLKHFERHSMKEQDSDAMVCYYEVTRAFLLTSTTMNLKPFPTRRLFSLTISEEVSIN